MSAALAVVVAALEQRELELAKLRQIVASYERDAKGACEASAPTFVLELPVEFRKMFETLTQDVRGLEGRLASSHSISAAEDAKLEARIEKRLAAIEKKLRPVRKAARK